ncbi:MAG: phosphate ABC transporter, permease protein PstA, partial [Actinobacteria bacterium]|nr:phosphate ABC transporter, permease protein PstA [Actinomycetota bacterium]
MSSDTLIAKPSRPWKPTPRTLLPDFIGAFITAFGTMAIVAATPLKGKLGFVIVLILMAIATASI